MPSTIPISRARPALSVMIFDPPTAGPLLDHAFLSSIARRTVKPSGFMVFQV